jgi:3-deoxy-D-manno-octulosonic-acid transferase
MIYNLVIYLYLLGVKIAALFQSKPAKMVQGHRDVFDILRRKIDPNARYIWFHAASLGEFEQGRPLIERIRREHPEYKILQTFFSPSGYEVRKDYAGADVVCYLPFDTPRNVRRFVELARPAMAFFVKYEFWQNYLNELRRRGIPVYSVSSIFRPNQIFFRSYGRDYAKVLKAFTHLFVQNEESVRLLHSIGVDNVSVVGDTRFDRVLDIFHAAKQLPLVAAFKGDSLALVAGSSWAPDEDLFIPYFNAHPQLKLIIAPHVVSEAHLKEIEGKLGRPSVRYTKATEQNVRQADCLIIDCYGLLSSIYRYGEMAYIGGGFGVSIHNVPEAAVYGIPVLFGPNNQKFMEAQQLKACQGAYEVSNADEFNRRMDSFLTDPAAMKAAGERAGRYISEHAGALEKIMKAVKL